MSGEPTTTSPEVASLEPGAPVGSIRRRYIRIPSVVPVDFQFVSKSDGPLDATVRTGTTRDLSETGLCLDISGLPVTIGRRLEQQNLGELSITMDIAMPQHTLRLTGRIVWAHAVVNGSQKRYRVGVEFSNVAEADSQAVMRFAKQAARRPKIIRATISSLVMVALATGFAAWWSAHAHEQEMQVASVRVAEATQRYRGVSAELEALTQDLLALSREVQADEGTNEELTVDPDGMYEPELIASAVEEVRASLVHLKTQLVQMRQQRDLNDAPPPEGAVTLPQNEQEEAEPGQCDSGTSQQQSEVSAGLSSSTECD